MFHLPQTGNGPNLKGFVDRIAVRPAMARVLELRHHQAFKAELQEEAKRTMLPQNEALAA